MTDRPDAVDPYVPERGNAGYIATAYELDLDYTVRANNLAATATVHAVALDPLARCTLDLVGLRVSKVLVDGRPARWTTSRGKVDVTLPRPLDAGDGFAVQLRYGGNPRPTRSTWGLVGWEELTDGVLVASQPTGSSTWFPCNDLARQKATFRVAVTTESAYRVVVNGRLVSRRARGSRTTWEYEQDEPTSPYLVTVNVGRYDEVTVVGAPVPVRAVLPRGRRAAFDVAFARQAAMVEVFTELFGPYPFAAGYTVVVTDDVLELPLEAQGQAIFGANHLDGAHERLIAHELAHQWFGNSLTASSWRDIWLHEGFACYAEWLWSERSGGPAAAEHARSHHERLARLPQDLVLVDPGPTDMFDDRVYKRGALVLHVLRAHVGDADFFTLLRGWAASHAHGMVTTDAFLATARSAGHHDVDDVLDPWLNRPALPPLPGPDGGLSLRAVRRRDGSATGRDGPRR